MIFQLKPSTIHGVGVFATEDITTGTHLPLFDEEDHRFIEYHEVKKTGVPRHILENNSIHFEEDGGYAAPKNFNRMSVGWYLNHSDTPNAACDEHYEYFAVGDIKNGEEVFIDYNQL